MCTLQVFTLCLTMYTFFGQCIVFLTPSIQMAQILVSGGSSAHLVAPGKTAQCLVPPCMLSVLLICQPILHIFTWSQKKHWSCCQLVTRCLYPLQL